jgi:hypothetical protein
MIRYMISKPIPELVVGPVLCKRTANVVTRPKESPWKDAVTRQEKKKKRVRHPL